MKQPRRQDGQLYITPTGAIRCKFWTTEIRDGVESRVRKDTLLCQSDNKHTATKKAGKWVFSNSVLAIRDRLMLDQNTRQEAFHQPRGQSKTQTNTRTILGFYENVYLPWAFKELRKSTVRGYGKVWRAHLKKHFGNMTFLDYTTLHASKYLTSLAEKGLSASSISHIRALGSGIFAHALAHHGLIPTNPWENAKSSRKYRQAPATKFYTVEEATGIIAAFAESHPDWAALIGLCFWIGLRPSEAIAVRWEDFRARDGQWFVHVSRGCVEGDVDTTKTADSKQALPVPIPLQELLMTWNMKSARPKLGWVFPGERRFGLTPDRDKLQDTTKPIDLRNLGQRYLKHAVVDAGFPWYGLYAFRRGLATYLKDLDIISAQAMLRHKNPDVTQQHYAKLTAADRLRALKFLEAGQLT